MGLVVPFVVSLAWRAVADGYGSAGGVALALLAGCVLYVPALRALLGMTA